MSYFMCGVQTNTEKQTVLMDIFQVNVA